MTYLSIKHILDDLLSHPLLQKVSLERAVNYTVHFLRIVGCPNIFEEKIERVKIENHRGKLPCDLYKILQVRNSGLERTMKDIYTYSSDNFHYAFDKDAEKDNTYKVQGGVIFTSLKNGIIEIAYQAMKVDEDGYPLIPDDSSFINALELYIKKQVFTTLFDTGKLTAQVYNNVLQEYSWAVGQASTSLIKPTIDQMEALTNSLNTLIPRTTEHSTGFRHNNKRERIKVH